MPAGRAHLGHEGIFDVGGRGRHCIEFIEEAIDGGRLLCRVGNVVAHQFPCLAYRFVAKLEAKLTGQLRAQQFDLAGTLYFDAFRVDLCLGSQLFGDAFGVGLGLFDDLFRLHLGFFYRLFVGLTCLLHPLGSCRRIGQLLAHRVLASGHQTAHRRHDITPHQPYDDRET